MVGKLDSARHRNSPAVQAVYTIGVDEARQIGRTSNTRDQHQVFGTDSELAGGNLDCAQDSEVSTTGTPIRFNNAFISCNR
jgi:hypothetical protein